MSLERLAAATAALAGTDEGDYLAAALERLAAGLDADQALELTGPLAAMRRNELLAQAGDSTGANTRWKQAGILAHEAARLDRLRDPNLVQRLLIRANDTAPIPRSRRRLYDALAAADQHRALTTEPEQRHRNAA